jgi:SAM-dependent MidA family methyltransferase
MTTATLPGWPLNYQPRSCMSFCRNEIPALVEGQLIEVNLDIKDWLNTIAEKLVNGYLITVDYGSEAEELYDASARLKGTLRAFRRHEFVDEVLTSPGESDITTSVDWTFVKNVGHRLGLEVERFQALDRFLIEAGALEELERSFGNGGFRVGEVEVDYYCTRDDFTFRYGRALSGTRSERRTT